MKELNFAVYVTGSIAAYKALILVRDLVKRGNQVQVIMTNSATRFVQPLSFQVLSQKPVITEKHSISKHGILHVDLARWTDVALIVPATANLIAKLANGISDTVATTCLLASNQALKVIIPAMNNEMLANPATQRNLRLLNNYKNYYVFHTAYGRLAEGFSGKGRMLEPAQIISRLNQLLHYRRSLAGYKIIVTAGGTEEPLDPVRFITNGSSGKMGIAIARVAQRLGAKVLLICGRITVSIPAGIKVRRVKTTEQINRVVSRAFPKFDALIMSAALADFRPVQIAKQKLHKKTRNEFSVPFRKTPDVLKRIARLKRPDQMTVGFAAETHHLITDAMQKLRSKHLDLIVANDVSNHKIGFGSDNNQVTFMMPNGRSIRTPVLPKSTVAMKLLRLVADHLKMIKGN